jgi:hypothetical protein
VGANPVAADRDVGANPVAADRGVGANAIAADRGGATAVRRRIDGATHEAFWCPAPQSRP